MFILPLEYDEMSPMARLDGGIRAILYRLFAQVGKHHMHCYLKVVGDTRSTAARSTVYVLDEGVVDSKRCFSLAKYRPTRSVWITPNGWKVAAVACGRVFVAETKVSEDRMLYRFSLATLEDTVLGTWNYNLQSAFAYFDSHFSERSRLTLLKMSKETILGVHSERVQQMLKVSWEQLKLGMNTQQLTLARSLEAVSRNCQAQSQQQPPLLPHEHADTLCPLQAAHGLLSAKEVAVILDKASNSSSVSFQSLAEILFLLEAGYGVNLAYLVRFLRLIETSVAELLRNINQLQAYWNGVMATAASAMDSLQCRAAVFVFWKAMKQCPTFTQLAREKDFHKFHRLIVGLPPVSGLSNLNI
ncbi:hypothetical protein BASA81_003601 [Batrachochytrium salamandrivorans]|nr:hypothetical protein BASA81_003601 [Batrachochytrium salamandrivorans]